MFMLQSQLLTHALLCAGHCPPSSGADTALFIACHDVDEANAQAARELFATSKLSLPSSFVEPIASALSHQHSDVRSAAAAALSAGIQVHCQTRHLSLKSFCSKFWAVDSILPASVTVFHWRRPVQRLWARLCRGSSQVMREARSMPAVELLLPSEPVLLN